MSSSSSDAEVHAKWIKTGFCSCSSDNYYCKHFQNKVVPMSSDFSRGAVNVGRFFAGVFTIGLSAIVNNGIKGLEHDCVELEVHCQKCGRTMYITTELSKRNGIQTRFGYYRLYLRKERQESIYLPYKNAIKALPVSNSYSLVSRNCSHYAVEAYRSIIRADRCFNPVLDAVFSFINGIPNFMSNVVRITTMNANQKDEEK